eukprot:TRINITY_DN35801_c0_g1_i1.p1 TRINITY_DN35801_c0_g1~~TRINITY_DN35801_c0_g1_i1.p1  ORF type:complete len:366 (+),score=31.56 TRINITY_DN35801_c0_g1_i1:2-1099(+)
MARLAFFLAVLFLASAGMNQVLVIYTGGTLGMVDSKHGLIPSKGFIEQYMKNEMSDLNKTLSSWNETERWIYSEKFNGKQFKYRLKEYETPIDSSSITINDFQTMASWIEREYENYDAFLILHGTDTLAYSASQLSYMFENLGKSVVLTAAMIPLCRPNNDAEGNIRMSLEFLAKYPNAPEVLVVFNNMIMRGNRIYKSATSDVDAFHSPNFPILSYKGLLRKELLKKAPIGKFSVQMKLEDDISVITVHPYIDLKSVKYQLQSRAVIFQTYGSDKMPKQKELESLIKDAIAKGTIVVFASQCRVGRLRAHPFANLGVLNAHDMTTEATLGKLSYLLGKYENSDIIKAQFTTSLRGEMTQQQYDA